MVTKNGRFNNSLYWLGMVLAFVGGGFLLGLGFVTIKILQEPEVFPLSKLLFDALEITEPLIYGSIDDKTFMLEAAKPMRYFFFGFIALTILNIVVRISSAMVIGGTRIVALASKHNEAVA